MISIVIVSHNRVSILRNCLDSIKEQTFRDTEIIVIDNGSKDNTAETLKACYPEARLIHNERNLLFCKAYNQGIDASKGDFIFCLNNDVVLGKDYLQEAFFSMSTDEKIGMISGKILRMDGKTIDSTGLFLGRDRKAVERGYGKKDIGQYDKPGYVFGVSGACAFFRKTMLKNIRDKHGYFDERLGMYYEDLDLCWRAQKKGWKAYYTSKAVAYHERSGTAINKKRGNGPIFLYLRDDLKKRYIRNRYICMKKNDSPIGFFVNAPFILSYEIKLQLYKIFKRLSALIMA